MTKGKSNPRERVLTKNSITTKCRYLKFKRSLGRTKQNSKNLNIKRPKFSNKNDDIGKDSSSPNHTKSYTESKGSSSSESSSDEIKSLRAKQLRRSNEERKRLIIRNAQTDELISIEKIKPLIKEFNINSLKKY